MEFASCSAAGRGLSCPSSDGRIATAIKSEWETYPGQPRISPLASIFPSEDWFLIFNYSITQLPNFISSNPALIVIRIKSVDDVHSYQHFSPRYNFKQQLRNKIFSRKKTAMKFRLLLAFILSCSAFLSAQTFRGTIQGTVTDLQGAVIVGADVTVSNPDTGLTRTI